MNRWLLPLMALIGAILGALAVSGIEQLRPAPAGLDTAIHDYLLSHPEVIPEAMQRLQDRESGKQIASRRAEITTPVGSAWSGNPKGDVTVVEYFDYNCGYCRASLPLIDKLVAADGNVRVVFRELPVLSAISHTAALASLAAAHQGHFAAFHQALYALGPVSDATITTAAAKAGVTLPGTPSPADEAEITRNLKTAGQLGMTGTPSWVVGDRMIVGAVPLETLQAAIAAARAG
jgi:protein-disulfide isomerase